MTLNPFSPAEQRCSGGALDGLEGLEGKTSTGDDTLGCTNKIGC